MKTNLDSRVMEVMKGNIEIPYSNLTKDIKKDFYIITYFLAEKLPDNVPFDLGKWEIEDFNADTIVVMSNKRRWVIQLDNVYSYDEKIAIEYRFFTIRED